MKAANANLKLYVYTNGGFAQNGERDSFPASWYLYDIYGNKIQNNWGLWLMDVGNANWAANRLQECRNALSWSGYDGCFVDNLGVGSIWPATLSGTPINPRTGQPITNAEWLNGTVGLATTIQTELPSVIMANGLVSGAHYFDSTVPSSKLLGAAGQALAESFVRTPGQGVTTYRSESVWLKDVQMLVDAASRGMRTTTITKVWAAATDEQKAQWHRYALGTFLLGDGGQHIFHFSYGKGTDTMAGHPWHDRLKVGKALAAYSKVDGAYQRSFENGRVIVNPSSEPITVPLDRTYTDLGGATRQGSITVAAHDASLLLTA